MYDNTVIILFIFILFNKSKRFIEFHEKKKKVYFFLFEWSEMKIGLIYWLLPPLKSFTLQITA